MPDESVFDETESEREGGTPKKIEDRVSSLEEKIRSLGRDLENYLLFPPPVESSS